MNGELLDPELQEPALRLLATGRLRAETDPDLFRSGMKGHVALADFFKRELGWSVQVQDLAEQIRLHKRRVDPPGDRGPLIYRNGRTSRIPQPAPPLVLIVIALICEQLWRRPRIALRELMQAVAQVCATDSEQGLLPALRIVVGEGVRPQEAKDNRQAIVDALKVLVEEGTITVDADLDEAITDEGIDMVVRASRERLSAKFSSLPPTLLELDRLPAEQHVAALSTETLLDHQDQLNNAIDPTLETRRFAALRRLVDDPATDPFDGTSQHSMHRAESAVSTPTTAPGATPYLHTPSGRDRGLRLLASVGLGATVRRDWWEITDPSGLGTSLEFPNGRRMERQAALAVLAELARRPDPRAPISVGEIAELLEALRVEQPRWAAAYHGRFPVLARAAAAELAQIASLWPDHRRPDMWHPTPGIHLWRVRLRHQPPPTRSSDSKRPLPLPNGSPDADSSNTIFAEGDTHGPA